MKSLLEIFKENKCDKASHLYHEIYEMYFRPRRLDPIKILEVGIWKGLSHKSWIEYFPNAEVYGIDIFTRIEEEDVPVLKEKRMHHIKGDSTQSEIESKIREKWGDIVFDIVIDDGLHTPDANRRTFENLHHFINPDTMYFVEDVWPVKDMTEEERKHHWILKKIEEITIKKYDEFLYSLYTRNSNPMKYDLRKRSGKMDSYLIKIERNLL